MMTTNEEFKELYQAWKSQIIIHSNSDFIFRNENFKKMTDLKFVPDICQVLKEEGPSHIVRALEILFPGVIECEGYVPLEDYCNIWISILDSND